MADQAPAPPGGVPLADAIAALRAELFQAWLDADNQQLRFRVSPVELTLQTAVTWTGKGTAGIKWWLLDIGAEASRAGTTTQTIKLSLDPVTLDAAGNVVSVFIDAPDVSAGAGQPECGSSAEPSFDTPG
ncbi:trypco2 family protein [Streptomyces sp. R35]|uniref:Trypco2 family protein n=1 Tax=Streptomyces sp. R35 TaxID=3238630 RepID=A0AB39SJS1_9ACTN